MKKLFSLICGATFILLLTSVVQAGTLKPIAINRNTTIKKAIKNNTDTFTLLFAFSATSTGTPGYYHVVVDCLEYDITTNTLYSINCPVNVNITLTSGPYNGSVIPFPSGSSTLDLGTMYFASDPTGSNYTATTSPTSVAGYPIAQELFGGPILP